MMFGFLRRIAQGDRRIPARPLTGPVSPDTLAATFGIKGLGLLALGAVQATALGPASMNPSVGQINLSCLPWLARDARLASDARGTVPAVDQKRGYALRHSLVVDACALATAACCALDHQGTLPPLAGLPSRVSWLLGPGGILAVLRPYLRPALQRLQHGLVRP